MKDKRAFLIFLLILFILWQLMLSLGKIFTSSQNGFNNPIFSVIETTNKGAAFGILENNSFALGVLGVFVLIGVCFYVFKNIGFEDKIKILSCSVFGAGILGNTTQRLTLGYVEDFIKLNFINFPVFNLFDVLICISVFMYILFYVKEELIKCK